MKHYSFIEELLAFDVLKRAGKKILKNIGHDPISLAMMAAPVPGSAPAGMIKHLATNKNSRKLVALSARKYNLYPQKHKA